jgi:hypothetical protein
MVSFSGFCHAQRVHRCEQRVFSAEGDHVHKPVKIPPKVLALLNSDNFVRETLETSTIPNSKFRHPGIRRL